MSHQSTSFTMMDPRTFDGDPYDVAGRAVAQLEGTVEIVERAIPSAKRMARNAEMSRRLDRGEEADAPSWPHTVEGRRWDELEKKVAAVRRELSLLRRVAEFNPRDPAR